MFDKTARQQGITVVKDMENTLLIEIEHVMFPYLGIFVKD